VDPEERPHAEPRSHRRREPALEASILRLWLSLVGEKRSRSRNPSPDLPSPALA
jgi:hypothetical protein